MRRGPVAPALALAALWALATTVGPTAITRPSDLPLYRAYATALGDGLLPYRDFLVEYPPLALAPIGLGGMLGTGENAYAWVFGALMLLAALIAQRAAYELGGPLAAWPLALLPLAAGAIVRTRFDLVPIALAVAGLAVLAGARSRPVLAFALLGAATATKLFPAVIAAVALAWLLGAGRTVDARRGAAAFVVVVVVACAPFVAASPAGFVEPFAFHVERPVQIESTPASVLWALGGSEVTGAPARPDRFRSNGLDGGYATLAGALLSGLQLVAVSAAVALAARGPRDRERLVLGALAAVLAFVVLGRVLSPQFLLWIAPLAAAALAFPRARAPAALALLAVPLTQLEFPTRYAELVAGETATVALVTARNAVLLVALGLSLARLAAPARSSPPAAPPSSG